MWPLSITCNAKVVSNENRSHFYLEDYVLVSVAEGRAEGIGCVCWTCPGKSFCQTDTLRVFDTVSFLLVLPIFCAQKEKTRQLKSTQQPDVASLNHQQNFDWIWAGFPHHGHHHYHHHCHHHYHTSHQCYHLFRTTGLSLGLSRPSSPTNESHLDKEVTWESTTLKTKQFEQTDHFCSDVENTCGKQKIEDTRVTKTWEIK